MEYLVLQHQTGNLTVHVKAAAPTSKLQQLPQSPLPLRLRTISLKFRVQVKCRHVQVARDRRNIVVTSIYRHKLRELPFGVYEIPLHFLEFPNSDSLKYYLTLLFARYRYGIDAKAVADAIKARWMAIRDYANFANAFGRSVCPLTVTLKLWSFVMFESSVWSNGAKKKMMMLKRVRFEEIEGDERSCVICLEGLEEESSIVEMPCLHLFDENCLDKWLEKNPSCPICRFQLPTN